jgi:hypothetical protein
VIGLGHTSDTVTELGHEKPIASGFNSLVYVHKRANYIHSASELVLEQVRALRWGAAIEIEEYRRCFTWQQASEVSP